MIRAGNPELRAVLIELAHRLIHRIPGRWAELACGMLARGKPTNVVVCAVANRWVRWVYHDLKHPVPSKQTSAQARQKGAAPSTFTIARPQPRVKAEATAKAEGARGRPVESE